MALQSSKMTDYGINATYWRVIRAYVDFHNRWIKVELGGYLDETTRAAGLAPLRVVEYILSGPLFVEEPTRAMVYAAIKTWTEFDAAGREVKPWIDATDV